MTTRCKRDSSSKQVCAICNQPLGPHPTRYCSTHTRSFQNLEQAYKAWTIGYGSIAIPEFLKRVESLKGTGEKVKDVARFLLENPSRWS